MPKLKVLITVPNFNTSGSGKVTLKIASSLSKEIFDPHIGCLHTRGAFFEVVKKSKLPYHIFPFFSETKNVLICIINAFRLSKFLIKNEFQIIHSMNYSSEFSEALAAKIANIPYVYSKNNMSWGRRRWLIKTFFSSAVFAQNTDMQSKFFNNSKKVTWITDGVDLKEFKPNIQKSELIQKYELSNDRHIITVANLVPIKGIEYLIDAFESISSKHPKLKLFIVGDNQNEYGKKLINLSKKKNLDRNIIFTGKVLNVSDYLSICKIFVLPTLSLGEGSPVALMEAMASNLFCIGSQVSGIKDQLSNCPNHMFMPGNSKEISKKIKWALSLNPIEFQNEIEKHNKLINSKFSLDVEIKNIEKEYLTIVNN